MTKSIKDNNTLSKIYEHIKRIQQDERFGGRVHRWSEKKAWRMSWKAQCIRRTISQEEVCSNKVYEMSWANMYLRWMVELNSGEFSLSRLERVQAIRIGFRPTKILADQKIESIDQCVGLSTYRWISS